jgi:hypothetical protein
MNRLRRRISRLDLNTRAYLLVTVVFIVACVALVYTWSMGL